jgi:acetate kinase
MRGLRSVATTMGFSALDGLPMGRRCGSLDAGVVLHLLQQRGMSADEVQHLLYERSGLLGVSGVSDDLRDLLASSDPHAREAVDLFVHRINQWLGALVATLGGLDALVFTGGIGENSALVRAAVCDWLHTVDSAVAVGVVHTDEESVVARHARACVAAQD